MQGRTNATHTPHQVCRADVADSKQPQLSGRSPGHMQVWYRYAAVVSTDLNLWQYCAMVARPLYSRLHCTNQGDSPAGAARVAVVAAMVAAQRAHFQHQCISSYVAVSGIAQDTSL